LESHLETVKVSEKIDITEIIDLEIEAVSEVIYPETKQFSSLLNLQQV
jgi:hypothetical protein